MPAEQKGRAEQVRALVEQALDAVLPEETGYFKKLTESMRYSLLAGGKRTRPVLLLEFCAVCGGDVAAALPFACALEMIHTYSLIHDDLPAMDNDAFRRGKPSNHMVYGEDTALLAGDALLTKAFEVMLSPEAVRTAGPARAAEAAGILARAAGSHGMAGGQMIDLDSEGEKAGLETLKAMDRYKTGALIRAAAAMGCALAGAPEPLREAADRYASDLGLAFQIQDDILDVTGNAEALGKPVGSDAENEKSTYVTLLGLGEARAEAEALTERAIAALAPFGEVASELKSMARLLCGREK